VGISLSHLDVRQTSLRGEFAGQRHIGRFEVQADDLTLRADPVGQQIQDPAGPAARIDRLPSLADPNLVQQQRAVIVQLGGLAP
jgi:hypothetical protein